MLAKTPPVCETAAAEESHLLLHRALPIVWKGPIGRNDEALLRKAALQPRLTDTRKKALDAHLQLSIRLRVLLEDAGLAEKRLQLRGGREGGFMWQTADALSAE